jgi:DNA-binding CsgD family transcriptional regulator
MSGMRRPELTDGQIACLQLVNQHHTSKEIARKLGISPFTVDQRLDAARRKLDATSRTDAARKFAMLHDRMISEPLVYYPKQLDREAKDLKMALSINDAENAEQAILVSDTVSSVAPAAAVRNPFTIAGSLFTLPPMGGRRHNLSTGELLRQSLNIALFCALMIAMIVILMTGTMRLFG